MDRNRNTTGSNNEEKNDNEKYTELDQNNKIEDTKNKNIVGGQLIKNDNKIWHFKVKVKKR